MTCAKVVVTALLTLPNGKQYKGENWCKNPQPVCPRTPGEDYTKCHTICDQPAHAEVDAIVNALSDNEEVFGGSMHVSHKRICSSCAMVVQHFCIEATHQ